MSECLTRLSRLGQVSLQGPVELTPTSSLDENDYLILQLRDKARDSDHSHSASESGTLSIRLVLHDTVPCIDRWLRSRNERETPPPHAIILNVLGGLDLCRGGAFVRVWFNGRLVQRSTAVATISDCDPCWEDDGRYQIGERYVLPLGANFLHCLRIPYRYSD